ncbi:MAG: tripartite tricarboxylate transporter substrate binding protein [Firmicutes bacterium]|jgi:putative tricarboxylic transport membrane protein|nr:tripartite tricarboxylate transporter substrate binding protein [Bacillota bacterium]
MSFKRLFSLCVLAALIFCQLPASPVSAADYPSREIRLIVASNAGGGDDAIVQMLIPYLEKYLGQRIICEYKPGAGMTVAWGYVKHSTKPDGYTLPMSKVPHLPATEITLKEEKQHEWDDIDPLYNIVVDPNVLVVRADSPFQTLEDYIAYAHQNPGNVVVADTGIYGDDWIANMKLQRAVRKTYPDFEATYVSMVSDNLVLQALLGGHIDGAMMNVGGVFDLIEDGRVRALCVLDNQRVDFLPEVPTAVELGYDVTNSSSRGFSFLKGTPPEIKAIMEDALHKAANDPEYREKAARAGINIATMNSEEYAEFMNRELEILKEIFAEIEAQ